MMIDGLILAGGQSRRMGQDKASLMVANKTLVSYEIEMMAPEVNQLIIARGEQPPVGADSNVLIIKDFYQGSEGPLSGLLAALQMSEADYLWVMSCDNYGFTAEIKHALCRAIETSGADIAYAKINGRLQPLMAIIKTHLQESLLVYLEQGERSVMKWYKTLNAVVVEISPETVFHSNINTPDDYQALLESL